MHRIWIRFAGAVVRAPDALNQGTESVLVQERLNPFLVIVTDNGAKDIVGTQAS